MNLPPEIMENILIHSDGKTLLKCANICPDLRNIVDYLTIKTNIWQRCCLEDIPKDERISYMQKLVFSKELDLLRNLYENWISWSDIKTHIDIAIQLSPVEIYRITCIATQDNVTAVGSEDGRIRLFNNRWNMLGTIRILPSKVQKISFFKDVKLEKKKNKKIYLLIAYSRIIYIAEYEDRISVITRFSDVNNHCVYRQFICFETFGGHISISKLINNPTADNCLKEITTGRLYSPYEVTTLGMWEDYATLVLHDRIKRISYKSASPVISLKDNLRLDVPIYDSDKELKCDILMDNIIVYRDPFQHSISFYIINRTNNSYIVRTFNMWKIFQAAITTIFLYGNVFIIGMYTGDIYFYNVDNWDNFDLSQYAKKVIVTNYPIIKIDVKETYNERRFYVATNFNIHELIGITIKKPFTE